MADIVDRIRKLLSLSKTNSSVEEAASAAAMAADLMFKHQIHEGDLVLPETPPEPVEDGTVMQGGTRYEVWKGYLVNYLAISMGAKLYTDRVWKKKEGANPWNVEQTIRYQVVGLKSVIETVSYMAPYLINEINRLADESFKTSGQGNGKTWKNNFRMGAVQEIGRRLTEQKRTQSAELVRRKEEAEANGTENLGLVLYQTDQLRQEEAYEKVRREKGLRTRATSGAKQQRSAYNEGREAGKNISLGGGKGLSSPKKELR